jgi:hypothetical protein
LTIQQALYIYAIAVTPLMLIAAYFFYNAFALWYKNYREKSLKSSKERGMNTGAILELPFKQSAETVRRFSFLEWDIYLNRARTCEENHSELLHNPEAFPQKGGRFWVSHKTKPSGWFSYEVNARGGMSYIHRITGIKRQSKGVKYLQLIFFSWWIAVVRKGTGTFNLPQEPA